MNVRLTKKWAPSHLSPFFRRSWEDSSGRSGHFNLEWSKTNPLFNVMRNGSLAQTRDKDGATDPVSSAKNTGELRACYGIFPRPRVLRRRLKLRRTSGRSSLITSAITANPLKTLPPQC